MNHRSLSVFMACVATVTTVSIQTIGHAQDWVTVEPDLFPLVTSSVGYDLGLVDGVFWSVGYGLDALGIQQAAILQSRDGGQTWSHLDQNFTPPGANNSQFHAFDAGPSGRVYAGGVDDRAGGEWFVERNDPGGPWLIDDQFQYQAGQEARCWDLKVDASGNVYASGRAYTSKCGLWVVRKRDAASGQWTTSDVFGVNTSGKWSTPSSVAIYPGTVPVVLVSGFTMNNKGQQVWTVRRSIDQGITWATVDSLGAPSAARAMAVTSMGGIFVVGDSQSSKGIVSWVVRESRDGGATWKTVDTFSYGSQVRAWSVGSDLQGNVYVGGSAGPHWLVRKGVLSAIGTWTWSTSDDFASSSYTCLAYPHAVLGDSVGQVFITGEVLDAACNSHWIIRKLVP